MAKKAAKETRQTLSRVARRGFTLIELSVVIIVIAMFAAIVTPRLLAVRETTQSATFRMNVVRFFLDARERAIQQRTTLEVAWDGNAFSLTDPAAETDETEAEPSRRFALGQNATLAGTRIRGEDVSEDEWVAKFHADGTATDAAIQLDAGGADLTLVIDGESGKTRLERGTLDDLPERNWPAGEIEKRETA